LRKPGEELTREGLHLKGGGVGQKTKRELLDFNIENAPLREEEEGLGNPKK